MSFNRIEVVSSCTKAQGTSCHGRVEGMVCNETLYERGSQRIFRGNHDETLEREAFVMVYDSSLNQSCFPVMVCRASSYPLSADNPYSTTALASLRYIW